MKPEDIRDIRAPLPIPPWWHWPLAIAVAALVALGVVLLFRAWRRHRARPLTPLELAERALGLAEEHARAGRTRQWADVVSELVRSALAARLGALVLPQTTSELARSAWAEAANDTAPADPADGLDAKGPVVPAVQRILDLLRTCDLARFALASFKVDELVENTAVARTLVLTLFAPKQEPEKAPASSPAFLTS